jgi:predicted RND superfamily exporter protein
MKKRKIEVKKNNIRYNKMPKTPMDYSKTIIYKIVCNDLSIKESYVGHTTDMTNRKWGHKSVCNNEKNKSYNLKIYQIIRENGGWDNWSMVLVEKFPCKDKYEACKREREVYEELEAKMNMVIPYITQEETKEYHKKYREEHQEQLKQYIKQYREEHQEEIKEQDKEYREKNKEKIKQYSKQYNKEHQEQIKQYKKQHGKQYYQEHKAEINKKVECEYCSKQLTKGNMSRHLKICKSNK